MKKNTQPPENLVIYEVEGAFEGTLEPVPKAGFLGFWVEGDYTFFFFDKKADEVMMPVLASKPDLVLRNTHEMKYSDWQDGAGFSEVKVGPLTVYPAWEESPGLEQGTMPICLDPGLAFGYGGHPTTRACLTFLVRVFSTDPPKKVLDFGAGTGVLSLAAARLGAKNITAIELIHLSAKTAEKNVGLNDLGREIKVIHGQAEDYLHEPVELVCSNLHLPVQETILELGGFDNRRWLILSGLFHSQAEKIEKALIKRGYRTVDHVREVRWSSLLMRGKED